MDWRGIGNAWLRKALLPPSATVIAATLALACAAQTAPATSTRPSPSYQQSILAIQERIQQNDLDGARALISAADRQYPRDGGIENLLGIIEIQQGHTDSAKRQFALAIEHKPKLASAYLNLARIEMQTAATDLKARAHAVRLYDSLLAFDPANGEAHYQLATVRFWEHQYQRSLDEITRLSPEDREKIGAQVLRCADLAALGRRDAVDAAATHLADNPDLMEEDANVVLPALREARRADWIEKIFVAANSHHPLSPDGLRILGLAQEANAKLTEARATMESAFAASPSSTLLLMDLARIAKESKDYRGALGYLAHARDLDPSNATLPYEFGVVCIRLGLLGEASKALGEAVKLAPENADYNFAMGTVSSFSQDPTQGRPYLEKAHALHADDPAPVLAIGTMYFRAKNFEESKKWLTQAVAAPGTAADAHFYLGRIARQEGRLDDAMKELTASNTLRPDNPDVLAELGQVATASRHYPEAQKYLDRAIQLDKDHYAANFALLQLYARTSDSRREAQSTRFDAIRDQSQEQYKEMMRIVEIRRDAPSQ